LAVALALLKRVGITIAVLAALCALYGGYRWLWMTTGWTWPFVVDDITMPALTDIVSRLFESNQPGGPWLVTLLLEAALFTAKEALAGFVIGAAIGLVIGILLHLWGLARRATLPYVVGSQTVPILAIAPMVVIWIGPRGPDWFPVSVIAAFLTFFPVAINTLRGLDSAEPRALELMHSYAAGSWTTLVKVKLPSALPYVFSALRIAATACVVGAIIGELPSGIQDGLGGAILNYNQYYSIDPSALWATNIVAAGLGIAFFGLVVLTERLVVRRAPANVA
jgi:NitT/TauT family transport system permease protein